MASKQVKLTGKIASYGVSAGTPKLSFTNIAVEEGEPHILGELALGDVKEREYVNIIVTRRQLPLPEAKSG